METKTIFANALSDNLPFDKTIPIATVNKLFGFFKNSPLFRWSDANNDCEDRANALCMILDDWQVPNCKAWVFSGYIFNKIGFLKNFWKYHVAAAIPVQVDGNITYYVIDPATAKSPGVASDWASGITDNPHSYYLIKKGSVYIFSSRKIEKDNWYERNKRNYNWTIQGLSGINGVSVKGKAQLRFNKKRVIRAERLFKELKKAKPDFL